MPLNDNPLDIQEEAQARKAKRARKRIRVIIALILVAIVALIALNVLFAQRTTPAPEVVETPGGTAIEEQIDDTTIEVDAITSVPNLVSFYGMSTDEVIAALGGRGTLLTVEETTDEDSPAITQLADIRIAPDPDSGSVEASAAELYLGLDANGKVVKIYYAVSLDRLGNSDITFESILGDTDFLKKTLTEAGAYAAYVDVTVPEESAYATYTTDANGNQVLTKCSYTYSGDTGLAAPTQWYVTYTYDYVNSANSQMSDVTRYMYVKIL